MGLLDFFKKGEKIDTKPATESSFGDFFKTSQPEPEPSPVVQVAPVTPPPVVEEVEPAEPEIKTYEIQAGDSLSKIAKKFYGQANDWNKIYEANKDVIKDPNVIYPGQEIVIPE